jgi:cytochrome c oxidase subunit 4
MTVNVQAHPVEVRGYIAVFGALLVLTIVTVGASYLDLPATPTILVALAIASVKAALVAMFFMHLKSERPMVYWPLGLTAILVVGLFASILWSEADHLFGTRFSDAFEEGPR